MIDDGEPYLLPLNFGYACENGAFSFFCHSAREAEVFAIRADKLSAKAKVPHGMQ